jgi:hypothetical protein
MNVGGVKNLFFITSMFECIAYAHVLDDTWRKFEPKSIQCVIIKYGENVGVKAYELYNQATQKSIYSWDVIFDEHYVVLPFKSINPQMFLQLSFLCQSWNQIQRH